VRKKPEVIEEGLEAPKDRVLHEFESRMLRWRADEVEHWQREQEASGPLMRSSR